MSNAVIMIQVENTFHNLYELRPKHLVQFICETAPKSLFWDLGTRHDWLLEKHLSICQSDQREIQYTFPVIR